MTRYISTNEVKNIPQKDVAEKIKELLNGRVTEINIKHFKDFHYDISIKTEEVGME